MVPSPSNHEDMDMNVDIALEHGSASTPARSQSKLSALLVSATAIDNPSSHPRTGVGSPSDRQQSPTMARIITSDATGEGAQLGLTFHQDAATFSKSQGIIHDTPALGQTSSSDAHIFSQSSKRKTSIVIEIPPWTGAKRRVIPLEEDTVPVQRSRPGPKMRDRDIGSESGRPEQQLPQCEESFGSHDSRTRLRQASQPQKLPSGRSRSGGDTAPQAVDLTMDSMYHKISGENAAVAPMESSSDLSYESNSSDGQFEDRIIADSDLSFVVSDDGGSVQHRTNSPKSPSSNVTTLRQSRHPMSKLSKSKTKVLAQLVRSDPGATSNASEEWVEEIMQYDNLQKRFLYSHTKVDKPLGNFNKMVLEAAYQAYRGRIKDMKDEDTEFIAVVARCTASVAKRWFAIRSSTQKPTKDLAVKASKTAKQKKIRPLYAYSSPIFQGHIKHYKRASSGDFKPVVRVHIEENHRALQEEACSSYKKVKGQELCRPCMATQANDSCCMIGFRYFYVGNLRNKNIIDNLSFGPDFFSNPASDKAIQFDMPGMSLINMEYAIACLSHESKTLLEQQTTLVEDTKSFIHRPDTRRQFCEYCRGVIVNNYYMCSACGLNLCTSCYEDGTETLVCTQRRMHVDEQFELCGRLHRSTMHRYLDVFNHVMSNISQQVLATRELSARSGAQASNKSRIPLYSSYDIKLEEFRTRWAASDVFIISNVGAKLKQKGWSMKGLLELTKGEDTVLRMKNCSNQTVESTTMQEFLQKNFTTSGTCRLMEWPSEPFEQRCKALYDDLLNALPLPEYTSPTGKFNLSRYFPKGQKRLGLDFKMYPCQGLGRKDINFGTFPLNCELADKIYICTYTQALEPNVVGSLDQLRSMDDSTAVVWDIFKPEDRPELVQFISTVLMLNDKTEDQDPLTSEQFFFNSRSLRQLEARHNVRPFRVYQRAGEAVMIPAGSVRQARYVVDTILTGLDFISPETMASTLEWYAESREYSLLPAKIRQPDPIQAPSVLFYATLAFMSAIIECSGTSSPSSSSSPPILKPVVSTLAFKKMK